MRTAIHCVLGWPAIPAASTSSCAPSSTRRVCPMKAPKAARAIFHRLIGTSIRPAPVWLSESGIDCATQPLVRLCGGEPLPMIADETQRPAGTGRLSNTKAPSWVCRAYLSPRPPAACEQPLCRPPPFVRRSFTESCVPRPPCAAPRQLCDATVVYATLCLTKLATP